MAQLINQANAQEIIQNVDNFLFDCDGVLWDGNGVIEGSLETVLKLKQLDDIVCTAYIAAHYLHNMKFQDKVYLIGKTESIGVELDQVGIKYFGPGPDPLVGSNYDEWLNNIKLDPEVKCVLVGFDPHINYMKIMKAASYLKNPDCLYVATNEDGSLPVKGSNICIPGTGCMVYPVTLAAARDPVIMGKPSTHMFDVLKKVHNLDPSRCMMTGDRINTDIIFAKSCGLRSFLVLSGIATSDDLNQEKPENKPDFYAQNLAELGKFI